MAKRKWPKDDKPVDFEDIIFPLVEAFKFSYELNRKNVDKSIPWRGLPQGKSCRHVCPEHTDVLKLESLRYAWDSQGRDLIETLMIIAVQLGIEQGRRMYLTKDYNFKTWAGYFEIEIDKAIIEELKRENAELKKEFKNIKKPKRSKK